MILKIIGLLAILAAGIVAYSLMMAASTSDERAAKIYKEYLEWKERRKDERN